MPESRTRQLTGPVNYRDFRETGSRPLQEVVLSRSLQVKGLEFAAFVVRVWENTVVYHLHGQTGRSTVGKIQDWLISSRNRVYHLYKSVQFTKKRLQRPEPGIKNGFEEMEHEFSFGIFRPKISDIPLLPEIFRCKGPKSRVPFTSSRIFREIVVNGKQLMA